MSHAARCIGSKVREFDVAWRVFRYMTSTVELMDLPNRITFDSMIEAR